MGKLSCEPRILHFSHHHPLELTTPHPASPASPCAACKQRPAAAMPSSYIYACQACNYFLHVPCSQLPTLINHPAHPAHPLSLLPCPAYPEGYFSCDACGRRGDGFSYHCTACDVDFHALCAAMPLSVTHAAHHHQLCLSFFPPYQHKGFSCDICARLGSNHWLYRCSACEFDAHLGCATAKPAAQPAGGRIMGPAQMGPPAQMGLPQRLPVQGAGYVTGPQQAYLPSQMGPQYQPTNGPAYMNTAQQTDQQQMGYVNKFNNNGPAAEGGMMGQQQPPVAGGPGLGNQLMQQVLMSMVDGASQQIGQTLVQSIIGGGDNGGNNGGGNSSGGGGGVDSSVSVLDVGSMDFSGFDASS